MYWNSFITTFLTTFQILRKFVFKPTPHRMESKIDLVIYAKEL